MSKVERFDYLLSNPPYQDEKNSAIFHNFQKLSDKVSEKNSLIYPADKWCMRSGKGIGLDLFSVEQLNDTHVTDITIYEEANQVFSTIALHGGISIVSKDSTRNNGNVLKVSTIDSESVETVETFPLLKTRTLSTSNNMNKIVQKVLSKVYGNSDLVDKSDNPSDRVRFLSESVFPTSIYGINSSFIVRSDTALTEPEYFKKLEEGSLEETYVRVLTNGSTGKGGRVSWFWIPETSVPKLHPSYKDYVVAISTRNAAGYGGRSQQARIFGPEEVFGDCRYGVAVFKKPYHAENFMKWFGTDVVRALTLSSSRRVKNFGINVPLLKSYKTKNREIDFTEKIETVNQQLVKLYGLTEDEQSYISKTVSTLGSFEMVE